MPNTIELRVKKIQNNIKQRAIEVSENPQQILAASTSRQIQSVQAALPSLNTMKRKIQRTRTANNIPLSNPKNISELFTLRRLNHSN